MANWAKLQEDLTGLPVVKRARHSIHFDKGNGEIVANFSGKPCHYQDTDGLWKPLDTAIKELEDGSLGAKGVPVRLNLNGLVRIINEQNEDLYSQVTTRVGVFNFTTRNLVDYINLPVGQVQDDLLIKETDLYTHTLRLTETGLREEIVIKKKPAFVTDKANLWLVLDTVVTGVSFEDGWLDQFEIAQMHFPPPTATDAEGREGTAKRYAKNIGGVQHIFTGLKFSELYRASYPVTIDPDFNVGSETFGWAGGSNADYATARSTSAMGVIGTSIVEYYNGQRLSGTTYSNGRGFFSFDTSGIDDGATITQVNLKLTVKYGQTCPVDHVIKKVDWTASRETAFDEVLAADADANWLNANDVTANNTQYTSANLSTAWVNKTGTTRYGLICSNDIAGTPPSGDERIGVFHSANATESYRPVLSVTYTAGSTGVPKHFLHYARLRSN